MPRISLTRIGYALLIIAAAVLWLGLHHGDLVGYLVSLASALALIFGAREVFRHAR